MQSDLEGVIVGQSNARDLGINHYQANSKTFTQAPPPLSMYFSSQQQSHTSAYKNHSGNEHQRRIMGASKFQVLSSISINVADPIQ